MKFYSPLRYPGGKTFLAPEIQRIIDVGGLDNPTYIEPYAGGAGAALVLLFSNKVKKIVINDLDEAIYAFWKSVIDKPEQFARKIFTTPVTLVEWKKQKQIYLDENAGIFEKGFATFFLNRTNHSGVINGGPIGGINQDGKYKINARYNKKDLVARIRKISKFRNRIIVLNEDGIELTKKYLRKKNIFIYLDPPYLKKGAILYLNHYKENDHKELADLLNDNTNKNWVLTYDAVKKISDFYRDRKKKRFDLKYNVYDSSQVRNAREFMIFSDLISEVLVKN